MSIIVKGGSAAVKKAKSYYDELKRAQANRDKKIKEKTPPSARRDMKDKSKTKDERSPLQRIKDVTRNEKRVSGREKRRRDRTGKSGLKVGTEEALLKGFLGGTGIAAGGTLVGAGVAADKAAKERARKQKEKFRKMTKAARKAESEGKKTFIYEGKEYSVNPRYSSGVLGTGSDYYVPVKPKSKKPVKKANGGVMKAKGYSRGGIAKKTPRGVGQAKRGFGRAMNNNG